VHVELVAMVKVVVALPLVVGSRTSDPYVFQGHS
jgi:hypothetical protein